MVLIISTFFFTAAARTLNRSGERVVFRVGDVRWGVKDEEMEKEEEREEGDSERD